MALRLLDFSGQHQTYKTTSLMLLLHGLVLLMPLGKAKVLHLVSNGNSWLLTD